jgi:hypothetical protein
LYYDEDSSEYIQFLFDQTVDITIAFSILIVFYYIIFIRVYVNKLRDVMISEMKWIKLLPQEDRSAGLGSSDVTQYQTKFTGNK